MNPPRLNSGSYSGKPLSEVPTSYLLWYFSRCQPNHPLYEEIKKELLKNADPDILERICKKELENLLIGPDLKRKLRKDALISKQRENLTILVNMANHSPNTGLNGSLNVSKIVDEILNRMKSKTKKKKP